MVKLDKIYTRGGDNGQTSLVDGSRVDKSSQRLNAIGDIDEANAILGIAKISLGDDPRNLGEVLLRIQNDLFDLGADLATPGADREDGSLRIQKQQTERLEQEIDEINSRLKPLTSFVLPGGLESATWFHLARTIVRRAERSAVSLASQEAINQTAIIYLNRLSDLLFVMARVANDFGNSDELWKPGKYGGKS